MYAGSAVIGHSAGSTTFVLIVLSAYCVIVCFIVTLLAKRASKKIRDSGIVGKIRVGDIDKRQAVVGSQRGVNLSQCAGFAEGNSGRSFEGAFGPSSLVTHTVKASSILSPRPGYNRQRGRGIFASAGEAITDLVRIIFLSPPRKKRRKPFHTIV